MKKCSKCKILKEYTDFRFHPKTKTNCQSWCKKCESLKNLEYKSKNPIKQKQYVNNYEKTDKFKQYKSQYQKEYQKRDIVRMRIKEYERNKKKINPFFKLSKNLRSRLLISLKSKKWYKNTHFNEYIGCTKEELVLHIEIQFTEGMTWQNHGYGEDKWHIDHILPLANAKTEEELYKRCHYTNLRPLWSSDNFKKSNKE